MTAASVDELIQELSHQDVPTRRAAARGLRRLAGEAGSAIPALIRALDDSDSEVRSWAAAALGWIGIPEPAAIARLGQMLSNVHEQDDVRGVASSALGRLGEAALPHLLEVAKGSDASGRQWSIRALGEAGAPASMILPTLINAMNDPDPNVREFARP